MPSLPRLLACLLLSMSTLGAAPNAILFIADDVSWNDLGCYGNTARGHAQHRPPPGAATQSLISSIDIAPTILSLAGVAARPTMQGLSFASVLADPSATTRKHAFMSTTGTTTKRMAAPCARKVSFTSSTPARSSRGKARRTPCTRPLFKVCVS